MRRLIDHRRRRFPRFLFLIPGFVTAAPERLDGIFIFLIRFHS